MAVRLSLAETVRVVDAIREFEAQHPDGPIRMSQIIDHVRQSCGVRVNAGHITRAIRLAGVGLAERLKRAKPSRVPGSYTRVLARVLIELLKEFGKEIPDDLQTVYSRRSSVEE